MWVNKIAGAKQKTIGTRQTLKAIQKGIAQEVFIAQDAENQVTAPIVASCSVKEVPLVEVPSMRELGKACGIRVSCATVAIIEE